MFDSLSNINSAINQINIFYKYFPLYINLKNEDNSKNEKKNDVDNILKIEDNSKNEKKEHNYDEFKCYYCQMIPKDKSIKTIILDNKKESKTIYFCSFKCFESEENVFKKYDK